MKFVWVLGVVLLAAPAFADQVVKVISPSEVGAETALPKELAGLRWNRWAGKNFTVCALDDVQAQYLYRHLEPVKHWLLARWGLPDGDFAAECKVIAVGDPALFKKLFNLTASRAEVRRGGDGRIKESVIFLLADGKPSQTIPGPLTEVCLAELGQRRDRPVPFWAVRGMAVLNGEVGQIRDRVAELSKLLNADANMFFSEGVLGTAAADYQKLDAAGRRTYDACAAALCLMVRKEFGQSRFLQALQASDPVRSLGFSGYADLDRSFKRYLGDLTRDLASGKTPDAYLQVTERKTR